MLSREQYVQIRYLFTVEKLNSVQIGERLDIPERTVRSWWKLEEYPDRSKIARAKVTDDFTGRIKRMLDDYPKLTGTQVYQRLQRLGYRGSAATVRRYLGLVRPKSFRAFLTLEFEPGEAMQVDFGYCGYLRHGDKNIRLCVCAVVL